MYFNHFVFIPEIQVWFSIEQLINVTQYSYKINKLLNKCKNDKIQHHNKTHQTWKRN